MASTLRASRPYRVEYETESVSGAVDFEASTNDMVCETSIQLERFFITRPLNVALTITALYPNQETELLVTITVECTALKLTRLEGKKMEFPEGTIFQIKSEGAVNGEKSVTAVYKRVN